MNNGFKLGLLFIAVMLISSVVLMFYHETIHYEVYAFYGCNSTIEYSVNVFGLTGRTMLANCSLPLEAMVSLRDKQLDAEIMGNNFMALTINMWLAVVFMSLVLGGRKENV